MRHFPIIAKHFERIYKVFESIFRHCIFQNILWYFYYNFERNKAPFKEILQYFKDSIAVDNTVYQYNTID